MNSGHHRQKSSACVWSKVDYRERDRRLSREDWRQEAMYDASNDSECSMVCTW
jgi:hypothetical protein